MANYNTSLQTWGSSGSSPPSGYNYKKDEPPVDEWDNYTAYNSIEDLKHLINLTNSRIESDKGASGNEPASPESSHLYFDEDNNQLKVYDTSQGSWRSVLYSDGTSQRTDSEIVSLINSKVTDTDTSLTGLDSTVSTHDHTGSAGNKIPDSGLAEDYVTATETGSYTDVDAIAAADGEISIAATSLSGLDTAVSGKLEASNKYTDANALNHINTQITDAATSISGLDTELNTHTHSLGELSDVNATGEGSGDGFDADTVDGEDASAFADSGHLHDSRYARLFTGVQNPVYSTLSGASGMSEGEMVYIQGDGLYVDDGN